MTRGVLLDVRHSSGGDTSGVADASQTTRWTKACCRNSADVYFLPADTKHMKKSSKILLGLATLWPFVYMIFFFMFIFSMFLFIPTAPPPGPGLGPGSDPSGPPMFFFLIFPLHFLTILWIIALTVFYMVNVFRNDRVNKDMKVLWAVVLFMGGMIAMPIYWYLYIWREETPGSSTPAALGSGAWTPGAQTNDRQQQYVPPPEAPNWRE